MPTMREYYKDEAQRYCQIQARRGLTERQQVVLQQYRQSLQWFQTDFERTVWRVYDPEYERDAIIFDDYQEAVDWVDELKDFADDLAIKEKRMTGREYGDLLMDEDF